MFSVLAICCLAAVDQDTVEGSARGSAAGALMGKRGAASAAPDPTQKGLFGKAGRRDSITCEFFLFPRRGTAPKWLRQTRVASPVN